LPLPLSRGLEAIWALVVITGAHRRVRPIFCGGREFGICALSVYLCSMTFKGVIVAAAVALSAAFLSSCSKLEAALVEEEGVAFSRESETLSGITLPYRKAEICTSASGSSNPLSVVIYLHGGTNKGNDNSRQLSEPAVDSIGTYLLSHKIASVFLVPQCPSDKSWGGEMNAAVKALVDKYIQTGGASCKAYILGGSMGGTGVWSMCSSYPGVFAGAMPVAGNPSRCEASNVALTPIITVMGSADVIMDYEKVSEFVSKLQAVGGEASFTLEEGLTHEETCVRAYTESRLSKLFSY